MGIAASSREYATWIKINVRYGLRPTVLRTEGIEIPCTGLTDLKPAKAGLGTPYGA